MNIDIVIPTNNRPELLVKCLNSLELAALEKMNVFVVINGIDHKSENTLNQISYKHLIIKILPISKTTNGSARNFALSRISSDWVYFIDDDAWVPENYFKKFYDIIKSNPTIDIIGGSDCANNFGSFHQRMLNATYNSPMAMGPTFKRHTFRNVNKVIEGTERNLTLCNLWINSKLLIKHNLNFPLCLKRNEENYLINEAKSLGANIKYSYQIKVNHLRRKSIFELLKTIYLSGFSRMQMSMMQKSWSNIYFFLPLFCVALIPFIIDSSLINSLVQIYIFLILISSIYTSFIFNVRKSIPILIIIHPSIHISYAFGMISYIIFKILRHRSLKKENEVGI